MPMRSPHKTRPASDTVDRKHRKLSKSSSGDSSSDAAEPRLPRPLKRKIAKHRRRDASSSSTSSSSTSDSSSSSSSSSSNSSTERKKLRKQLKRTRRDKLRRKSKLKAELTGDKVVDKEKDVEEQDDIAAAAADVPLNLMDKSKSMAPMTKEEWDKKQSVVKRVYDEASGRHRLIKGDGEVIEEIVSRDRHKAINQQATKGDGDYFQAKVSTTTTNATTK